MTTLDNSGEFDHTFDIKYVGPFPEIEFEIPAPNGRTRWCTVTRDQVVTVEADHAARLCRQVDAWRGRNDTVRAEIEAHQQALGTPVAGSGDDIPAEHGDEESDIPADPDPSGSDTADPEED